MREKSRYDFDARGVETAWWEDKRDTEKSLQVTARFLGCRFVNQVIWQRSTEESNLS